MPESVSRAASREITRPEGRQCDHQCRYRLVETRGRHGTFVTAFAAGVPAEAQRLAVQYAAQTRRLGVEPAFALDLVRAALGIA